MAYKGCQLRGVLGGGRASGRGVCDKGEGVMGRWRVIGLMVGVLGCDGLFILNPSDYGCQGTGKR